MSFFFHVSHPQNFPSQSFTPAPSLETYQENFWLKAVFCWQICSDRHSSLTDGQKQFHFTKLSLFQMPLTHLGTWQRNPRMLIPRITAAVTWSKKMCWIGMEETSCWVDTIAVISTLLLQYFVRSVNHVPSISMYMACGMQAQARV